VDLLPTGMTFQHFQLSTCGNLVIVLLLFCEKLSICWILTRVVTNPDDDSSDDLSTGGLRAPCHRGRFRILGGFPYDGLLPSLADDMPSVIEIHAR